MLFCKHKEEYGVRISDRSSDVCSSDRANKAIQDLLNQRAQATAALSQERAKHLEAYPTVQQLKAQVDEVNRQIQTIATGIKQSIRQEYESARLQEGSLEAQVDRLKSATLSEQDRSVRYNILAREAATNRTLYDGLLQRSKEVSAAAGRSEESRVGKE